MGCWGLHVNMPNDLRPNFYGHPTSQVVSPRYQSLLNKKKSPKLCQEAVASTRFVFMSDNLGISWFSFVSLTQALGINRHILR